MARKSYKDKLREFAARREMAVSLRERGFSLHEIGQKLTPKVSRQRVAQMLRMENKEE